MLPEPDRWVGVKATMRGVAQEVPRGRLFIGGVKMKKARKVHALAVASWQLAVGN
jgi:hypothetical protein